MCQLKLRQPQTQIPLALVKETKKIDFRSGYISSEPLLPKQI